MRKIIIILLIALAIAFVWPFEDKEKELCDSLKVNATTFQDSVEIQEFCTIMGEV